MYWDGDQSTYLPAPSNSVEGMSEIKAEEKKGKEKEKKEKVKVAKKVAKVTSYSLQMLIFPES